MRKPAALLPLCVLLAFSLAGCGSGTTASSASASLSANPNTLPFTATVGQTSATQTVTVTNTGKASAILQAPTITGANASDFILSANTCTAGASLGPTAYCTIAIAFQPAATGNRTAALNIPSTAPTQTVELTGSANTIASVSITTNLAFASTLVNQTATGQIITVSNTGGAAATLASPALTGVNAIDYAISSTTCTNTLAANATCAITVTFTPTASGTRNATLSLGESSLGVANTYTTMLTGTGTPTNLGLQGTVLSGTQPIANATIQLYTVGATGNGSASKPMLSTTITTNAAGNFYLATGSPLALSFTCTNSTDQLYIVATGGNPGLTPASTNNAALTMMTALGNCGALTTASSITINELTTAAATWALAPFTTRATNIGASATNTAGITNAMLDAQLLANSSTGAAATLPSNLTVEPGKLAALADALASCIGTDGNTACTPLFTAATPTGSTAPSNTFSAALNIVKNPGQNVAAIYNLIPTTPPYATTLTQAPNDWTITLAISGGGLNAPTALDIDRNGSVWVAGYQGNLSGFTPQGTPLNATGFGLTPSTTPVTPNYLSQSLGLTIDTNGNIWVTSEQQLNGNTAGAITRFVPNGSGVGAPGVHADSSINFPVALSADTNGNIFIANNANAIGITVYTSAGSPLASHGTGLGASDSSAPVAVAADAAHGVWIANSESATVVHVSATGAILSDISCCAGTLGSNGIATDSAGNAWISDYGADAVSMISPSASGDTLKIYETPVLGTGYAGNPAGVAIDAAQNVWVANFRGRSINELAGINSGLTLGTMLSPAAGFGYSTSATPTIVTPEAVVPDASGNLWVTNNANNNLIMFFGLATPTKTPVQPTPVAP